MMPQKQHNDFHAPAGYGEVKGRATQLRHGLVLLTNLMDDLERDFMDLI